MQNLPVDAVITWVDGDDPRHTEKRARFLPEGLKVKGAESTRFSSENEIIYCVLSILKFAPYFNKIYIVTDEQTPPIFDAVEKLYPSQRNKIEIVDHKEIFEGFEDALPTFNSISIEMVLHRIKDLNDRFVYFNDDVFLVRPTSVEDWFPDDKVALRGRWFGNELRRFEARKSRFFDFLRVPPESRKIGSKLVQMKGADIVGSSAEVFIAAHVPHPRRRSTLEWFSKRHPDEMKRNLNFRFRSSEQFSPQAVANHIEMKNGTSTILDDDNLVYIYALTAGMRKVKRRIRRIEENKSKKFLCVQSLDQASAPIKRVLLNWIKNWTG